MTGSGICTGKKAGNRAEKLISVSPNSGQVRFRAGSAGDDETVRIGLRRPSQSFLFSLFYVRELCLGRLLRWTPGRFISKTALLRAFN
jgi:hypothetical protein